MSVRVDWIVGVVKVLKFFSFVLNRNTTTFSVCQTKLKRYNAINRHKVLPLSAQSVSEALSHCGDYIQRLCARCRLKSG